MIRLQAVGVLFKGILPLTLRIFGEEMFEISDEQKAAFKEAFDDILGASLFGKTCKIVYQPKLIDCQCSNLVTQPNGSHWLHGGPLRIDQQGCSMCGGSGKVAQEYSENIVMSVNWKPVGSTNYDILYSASQANIKIPYNIIVTRGFIVDLPKVKRCIQMQIQLPLAAYGLGRYTLRGEPGDSFNAIQDKYFLAVWDRIG